MARRRILIMGAAGRDFHNFNTLLRKAPDVEVMAFTATQIPNIDGRIYPPELAGDLYPTGIPIYPEDDLSELIKDLKIDEVFFSYSDVSHQYLMEKASQVIAAGAQFSLFSAGRTMIHSTKPIISLCAVRTGVGKSQTSRYVSRILKRMGKRVVAIRHPMPYGDLAAQACQRFESYADLDKHECTIEEREEYEPHIDNGFVVYAGVDYEQILRQAEKEADVILWDGGNNDTPFYKPDLAIVLLDPHRAGHELKYFPGMVNLLMADLLLVNKIDTASAEGIAEVIANCKKFNPSAQVIQCESEITVDHPEYIQGKRALVIEDGPTLTHGGMEYGAGWFAAKKAGAAEIVDVRPFAVGSIQATFEKYPNAGAILPAMGYGETQVRELEATIEATPADVVVEGTPINLSRILKVDKPLSNVSYELKEVVGNQLEERIRKLLIG